jgi:GAF domain-containing protein
MPEPRLLVVDPDPADREATVDHLRTELTALDPTVDGVGSVEDATAALDGATYEAIVAAHDLPDGTGVDVVGAASETSPDAGCVLYTDTHPDEIDTAGTSGRVVEYVDRSVFGVDRLAELLRTTVVERTQASYPLPDDESRRVAALRSYDLDADALGTALDRVATLAATHFDVDRASVNVVGEHRYEFLGTHGAASEWATMDREDSICTFTILEDDGVMTVSDVAEDPRFASRAETMTDMGVRSYLGASLRVDAGHRIGSVCVYDDEPRTFDDDDRAYVSELADVAADLVEFYGPGAEGDVDPGGAGGGDE